VTVAVIVGSFDPLLKGQIDLIMRTAEIAERVVVAVEATPSHKPLYTLEERLNQFGNGGADFPDVKVYPFDGDWERLVAATGATAYVVALRGTADVDAIAGEVRSTCARVGLELIALLAEPTHAFVTTALVRDVARLGGDISPFVA
jgi:pantetheine-phosphate adenylyltransferase